MPAADRETVATIRAFNRFYTRQLGVLSPNLLGSPFSLTEIRVMLEVAHRPEITAKELLAELDLDPGYLSRILQSFQRKRLLTRTRSRRDARHVHLALSPKGKRTFAALDRKSSQQVSGMLAHLPAAERARLAGMMQTMRHLLAPDTVPRDRVCLRPPAPGDLGWIVQRHGALYAQEYGWDATFEALVARIVGDFGTTHDPARERCWIAELDGQPVGCVFLVRGDDRIAKLRLLLVEPTARGHGVGRKLVAACVEFARQAGYERITLWTNSVLTSARRIYEGAGFKLIKSEPHHSFGHDLIGQTWELDLSGARGEQIIAATSPQDIASIRQLFAEYAASLDVDLGYQGFTAELAGLPGAYAPPQGRLLLALVDGTVAGCAALRPQDGSAGELKRLYVRPSHQGRGLGRRLAQHLVAEARGIGYTSLRLDTRPNMAAAIRLYESLGFARRDAYYDAPDSNVFMELVLATNGRS